ncbi:DUF4386 domain-containing protein [Emticicia agri]|nr:DUF4386 domain-containing protein [Emticicia agri]
MSANNTVLKFFGIFFIGAFIFYAIGNYLIESQIHNLENLSAINQQKNQMLIGALLITFLHTLTNIGLVVILFSAFKDVFNIQAYAYLATTLISTILLAIGGICLVLIIPVSEWANTYNQQLLDKLLQKGQFYFYQFGMMLWCIGGLIMCNILIQTRVVPKWLSVWGFIGYVVFMAGCLFEIFGVAIGTYTSIVGGLFEITLSLVAIFKGFRSP